MDSTGSYIWLFNCKPNKYMPNRKGFAQSMSTINVDNINEYTTDGKVNVGHDIKLASGKSVLNSDGKSIGALVPLQT